MNGAILIIFLFCSEQQLQQELFWKQQTMDIKLSAYPIHLTKLTSKLMKSSHMQPMAKTSVSNLQLKISMIKLGESKIMFFYWLNAMHIVMLAHLLPKQTALVVLLGTNEVEQPAKLIA